MSANPMILSGDSFESSDVFNSASATSTRTLGSQMLAMKPVEEGEELNSHLPPVLEILGGDGDSEMTSPLYVQSSVLDSVFSTTLEGHEDADHTPMFDELDFIMDGAKVNLRDDWVSLFGNEEHEAKSDLVTHDDLKLEELDALVQEPAPVAPSVAMKRLFADVEESFEFKPVLKKPQTQSQLFTPNTSSTLPTPVLDAPVKSSRASSVSQKKDHLGCVTYSKKQRTQPLAAIETDVSDPVLMKRAKNTEAARRSRARKMERMSQLEERVESLMGEKADLESEVGRLRDLLRANNINF